MSQEPSKTDICVHIFAVSAGMVGVCLTVIGLFRVITTLNNVSSIGDDLLAINALAFLTSFILSYIALRTRESKRHHQLEKIADAIFLTALSMMAIICDSLLMLLSKAGLIGKVARAKFVRFVFKNVGIWCCMTSVIFAEILALPLK